MAIVFETNDLPAAGNLFKAFDDACALVLKQLGDDLKLRENETRPPFANAVNSRFQPTRRDHWAR